MEFGKLFISFSGGETSAYMTQRVLRDATYSEAAVLFANTGLEHERTLEFVRDFEENFNIPVVWVEAEVQHGVRKRTQAKVVDFSSASRNGEPFEEVIKKYGIPNPNFPHCTRELKMNPLHSYIRKTLGWSRYSTAIGIRADEFDRMAGDREARGLVYPLISWNVSKPEINRFWREQPFRLGIQSYEGNCVSCWKKSNRKHFTLLEESRGSYDFFRRMEKEHAHTGAGVGPRRFFRSGRSVEDMEQLAIETNWKKAGDDSRVYNDKSSTYGCSESCEIY